MARLPFNNMLHHPSRRSRPEARDGVMFFVLPPLLLALVFGICAMASDPVVPAPAANKQTAKPAPVAAVEEPTPEPSTAEDGADEPVDEPQPTEPEADTTTAETETPDAEADDADDFEDDEFVEEEE